MRAASTIATVTATAAAAVLFGTLGNADAGSANGHPGPQHSHSTHVPHHPAARSRPAP